RREQTRAVGDPDLIAATVVVPAGEDDGSRRSRDDARTVWRLDVDRRVARVEVLADRAAGDRPGEGAAPIARRCGVVTRAATAARMRRRLVLRLGDALAEGARNDQLLADHEVRVGQPVKADDFVDGRARGLGDRLERIAVLDGEDESADRWDHQRLADVELFLR